MLTTKAVAALLRRYGRAVVLLQGEAQHRFDAYLSPTTHRNRAYLERRYSPIGWADQNVFVCLAESCEASRRMRAGDLLQDGDSPFLVIACERMRIGTQDVFVWALLRRATVEKEEAACGML